MAEKKTAASEAASLMGRRSVKARIENRGEAEFQRKLQKWGKQGGRPKGAGNKQTKKGGK